MRDLLWLAAFAIPLMLAVMAVSFMSGRIAEEQHHAQELAQVQAHYDALAANTDWLTQVQANEQFKQQMAEAR